MKGQKPSDYRVIYINSYQRLSAQTVGQISPFLCGQQPTNIYAPYTVTSADGQGYKPQLAGVFARHEAEHIVLSEVASKIIIVVGDCGQSWVKSCCIPAGRYRKVGSWPAWVVTSIRKKNPFQISKWINPVLSNSLSPQTKQRKRPHYWSEKDNTSCVKEAENGHQYSSADLPTY